MRLFLLTLCVFWPAIAMANITCSMTLECLPDEDCQDTSYDITVTDNTLSDVTGELQVTEIKGETGTAWSGGSAMGFHMLSVDAEGMAKYTLHMTVFDKPMFYIGTCSQ